MWFGSDGVDDFRISASDTRGARSPTAAIAAIHLMCVVGAMMVQLGGVDGCCISASDTRSASSLIAAISTYRLKGLCNGDGSAVVVYDGCSLITTSSFSLSVKMLAK